MVRLDCSAFLTALFIFIWGKEVPSLFFFFLESFLFHLPWSPQSCLDIYSDNCEHPPPLPYQALDHSTHDQSLHTIINSWTSPCLFFRLSNLYLRLFTSIAVGTFRIAIQFKPFRKDYLDPHPKSYSRIQEAPDLFALISLHNSPCLLISPIPAGRISPSASRPTRPNSAGQRAQRNHLLPLYPAAPLTRISCGKYFTFCKPRTTTFQIK